MKFNPNEVLQDYENKPIKSNDGDLCWKDVFSIACNSQTKDDNLTAEDKIKAFQITQKVFSSDKECELTVNQLNFVLERVKKIFTPLVVGRTLEKFESLPGEI